MRSGESSDTLERGEKSARGLRSRFEKRDGNFCNRGVMCGNVYSRLADFGGEERDEKNREIGNA